jgi:hypothetical protein
LQGVHRITGNYIMNWVNRNNRVPWKEWIGSRANRQGVQRFVADQSP